MITEAEVEAAAKSLAISPTIDMPKLPWRQWMGTARTVLTAAAAVLPTLRCDECDNGVEDGWIYCAFCAKFIRRADT